MVVTLRAGLERAGGWALAGVFGAVAIVRRDRALHAYGRLQAGELVIDGGADTGTGLLDEPERYAVTCRISRAASLSRRGPDVGGLALRIEHRDGPVDMLFASTGTGAWTRYLLRVHREPLAGPLTTLLPLRSPRHSVVLLLDPQMRQRLRLSASLDGSPWRPIGSLSLTEPSRGRSMMHGAQQAVRFDPVGHHCADLVPPPWVRRLRDPSYRAARAVAPHARG